MIHRELESSFRAYIEANRAGTNLAGVTIRTDATESALQWPCVIVQATNAELVEGGVRSASRVTMQFSVVCAASNGTGWQTAHKNRVAALARLLDDTNTQAAITAINAATTDFILYGWHITGVSSETSANHQMDTIAMSLVAGEYSAGVSVTGKTNASPQDYSLRHEIEQVVAAHLGTELPGGVTANYATYPYYSEGAVPARRIVVACQSASKPYPQLERYTAEATIHIITPGTYDNTHAGVVKSVQQTLADIVAQDFTSANLTVAGVLESGHSIDRSANALADILPVTLYCQQN